MISCSLTTGFIYLSGIGLGAVVLGSGYLTFRDTRPWTNVNIPQTTARDDTSEHSDDEIPARQPTDSSLSDPMVSSRPSALDILPEDERQIVEPVLTSPGITQLELRDRADFSKAKISQTVTDLEKRGILSREASGRTYRLYPEEALTGSIDCRSDPE